MSGLKFFFAGLVFYFLFKSDKIEIEDLKLLLNPKLFISLFVILLLVNVVATLRWQTILNSQGMTSKFWPTFKLTLIGAFFNFAIPGGVGGDVVKAFYFIKQHPGKKMAAGLTVVMDRVIGLTVMAFAGFLSLFLHFELLFQKWEIQLLFIFLGSLVLLFVVLWSVVFIPQFQNFFLKLVKPFSHFQKLTGLIHTLLSFSSLKTVIFRTLYLSVASQFLFVLAFFSVSQVVNSGHPWDSFLFAAPIGLILSAVPITPAGIGVGQLVFYFLFNLTSTVSNFGSIAATMIQGMTFIVSLMGAYFYLTVKRKT